MLASHFFYQSDMSTLDAAYSSMSWTFHTYIQAAHHFSDTPVSATRLEYSHSSGHLCLLIPWRWQTAYVLFASRSSLSGFYRKPHRYNDANVHGLADHDHQSLAVYANSSPSSPSSCSMLLHALWNQHVLFNLKAGGNHILAHPIAMVERLCFTKKRSDRQEAQYLVLIRVAQVNCSTQQDGSYLDCDKFVAPNFWLYLDKAAGQCRLPFATVVYIAHDQCFLVHT